MEVSDRDVTVQGTYPQRMCWRGRRLARESGRYEGMKGGGGSGNGGRGKGARKKKRGGGGVGNRSEKKKKREGGAKCIIVMGRGASSLFDGETLNSENRSEKRKKGREEQNG